MRAQWILLTHFSQRYPKVPVLTSGQDKVGIAFDLMSFNLQTVRYLPLLVNALRELFKEEEKEDEEKEESSEKGKEAPRNKTASGKSEKTKPAKETKKSSVNK